VEFPFHSSAPVCLTTVVIGLAISFPQVTFGEVSDFVALGTERV
jgi:hypothetical protein